MYRLSKSLSTNPEVSEGIEHKKILLHIDVKASLDLPEKSLKNVIQVDCSQQQHHLRLMNTGSIQRAGITFVQLEVVYLDKEINQLCQRQKQRLFLQPYLQL